MPSAIWISVSIAGKSASVWANPPACRRVILAAPSSLKLEVPVEIIRHHREVQGIRLAGNRCQRCLVQNRRWLLRVKPSGEVADTKIASGLFASTIG